MNVNQTKLTYSFLLITGLFALIISVIFVASILAFVGLGLVFWGIIFAYIRTEEYTKKALLDATINSQMAILTQALQGLQCQGDAIYLPPKYFTNPDISKVYIPKQKVLRELPTPEQIQKHESLSFFKNSLGILLTPPGAELAKLFEKILETNFTRVDMQYLQQNMPKLFIEELEITRDFEIKTENNKILVRIENSKYDLLSKEVEDSCAMGSLLSSAIACAIAKTTGKPIRIEKQQASEDAYVTIEYWILEEV
jgi:hypothetical protein